MKRKEPLPEAEAEAEAEEGDHFTETPVRMILMIGLLPPLNLFENQVIPIGLHNLSKSFRPNISTIRVLSLGTKFIPKWKFEKRNNAFKNFNDFIRRMHNKVYFTETKPGVFEKNSKFKLKTNFVANTKYKEVEAFGWRVRDRINFAVENLINPLNTSWTRSGSSGPVPGPLKEYPRLVNFSARGALGP